MKRFALMIALAAVLSAGAAAPAALAQSAEEALFQATTLNLSAYGETRVAPDQATITLGVSTQGATAAEAMAANRTRMNAAIAALKAQAIAERDIQTSGLNLNPQYVYEQNKPQRLTGYQASNDVTITVRDLARLGPTVDAVVAAGANQINGISFGLANPRAAEDQARRAAVQALAAKAALYADATGMRLARLVNLSEGGGYTPQPPRPVFRMAAQAADSAPTPVQPGELSVRIDVTGMYELAAR
ncbi:MAG TPA: SIMPL domain-containing protein [Caulobacteraceae bacterium]|nr:SIMPL domain-containing protein [Caulobacteraceae bacterium]